METEIITWIFLGIFGLFIYFKFKKFLPFRQDARSINYYETKNFPIRKQTVLKDKEIKVIRKIETPIEEDEPIEKNSEQEDPWSKIVQDNADFANEMFGLGKKERKKDDDSW